MVASGVELASGSRMLGHGSAASTASKYAGVRPVLREDAAFRLEALLSRLSPRFREVMVRMRSRHVALEQREAT